MNLTGRRASLLLILATPLAFYCASHAIPSFHGEEQSRWEVVKESVVVGLVKEMGEDGEPGRYRGILEPRATLTGVFDAGLHPELPIRFYASVNGGTSVRHPPEPGDLIMAVLRPPDPRFVANAADGLYVIPVDFCTFMPDDAALVVLKGLDDPRVAETLKKIQAARAKGRAREQEKSEKIIDEAPKRDGSN